MFDAHLIRMILDNPVYCGKIAFGRRKREKKVGTRNEYHLVNKMYDNIDDMEKSIAVCRDRIKAIEAEKLTGDNVYKVLIYFDKLYAVMEDADKRNLLSALIDEIQGKRPEAVKNPVSMGKNLF